MPQRKGTGKEERWRSSKLDTDTYSSPHTLWPNKAVSTGWDAGSAGKREEGRSPYGMVSHNCWGTKHEIQTKCQIHSSYGGIRMHRNTKSDKHTVFKLHHKLILETTPVLTLQHKETGPTHWATNQEGNETPAQDSKFPTKVNVIYFYSRTNEWLYAWTHIIHSRGGDSSTGSSKQTVK